MDLFDSSKLRYQPKNSETMETCIADEELAKHIRNLLHRDIRIDDKDIHVTVRAGWVFLDGQVDFESDRDLVQSCVEEIFGVCRLTNNLTFPRVHTHSSSDGNPYEDRANIGAL
jgi:osmotically-inducible protein OsmY